MKYIKYMPFHSLKYESRDRREIITAFEYGMDVAVLSPDYGSADLQIPEDIKVYSSGVIKLSYDIPWLVRKWQILRNAFRVMMVTIRLEADVLSCHDLISLRIAFWARLFRKNKYKLIYDSHEFEMGRNAQRGRIKRLFIAAEEKYMMERCTFSIMVNDSIADEVVRIHHLKNRPIVLRSTPIQQSIDYSKSTEIRNAFLESMEGVRFLLMYHGAICDRRGIEQMLMAIADMDGVGAVIMGPALDLKYLDKLKKDASIYHIEDRTLFHEAVRSDELVNYISAADAELIFLETDKKSYYYALPNKMFESVQAMTPIIAVDIPELRRIIDQYDIGLLCESGDINSLKNAILQMKDNVELMDRYKKNMISAKEDLCWENEKKVLIDAWQRL